MQVHAIQTGTVTVRESQREGRGGDRTRVLNTLRDRRWTAPLPIHAWVIRHPEGTIVVDTGETAAATAPGYFPRWHPYFRLAVRMSLTSDEEIGPQLDRLGIDRAGVRWVVLTHMHTDHVGGLSHFPDSEILVARKEYEAASGFAAKLNGYLPHRRPEWLAPRLIDLPEEAFGPFPQSLALTEAGDVHIVATPGHSPGHMSVVLTEEDGGRVFFAGDTSYTQDLMLRGAVDGVAPDPAAARTALERVRTLARERPLVYLPTHDPESAARLEARAPVP